MRLKTIQLSCSRLTSSVYSVDCSCLHLTLISESHSQSFRTTENDVNADVGLFHTSLPGEISYTQYLHVVICVTACYDNNAGESYVLVHLFFQLSSECAYMCGCIRLHGEM